MKISVVWMAANLRGLELLSPIFVHCSSWASFTSTTSIRFKHNKHILQNNFYLCFFTSPKGLMSALNFCSHIPYLMSFLSCFPLHNYLMFAWFYVQFLLLSLSSNFPSFSAHFILFSTPYLPYFCFVLCSIFITELEFELYIIFSPGSWHVVRLRPNIFILS